MTADLSRRSFLTLSAGGAVGAGSLSVAQLLPSLAERAVAGAPAIVKPLPPEWFIDYGSNAEMRWDSVDPRVYDTPAARLFVRDHTSTPTVDASTYALRIHGDGLKDPDGVTLSLAQIKAFRHHEVTSVHECTGNGRSFFGTQQGQAATGTQWTLGAVGTVRWTGVRLRDVLGAVGVRRDAVSIMATGLDPNYVDKGTDYGPVRRPFPIEKAYDDALLAWAMNGDPLLPDHGFPLRLVLPGWVGIGSIKWLGSLEVSTTEQTSPWSTTWYTLDGEPLTVNPVRSAWELAWDGEIPAARRVVLTGRSWSGAAPIARVEVSTDTGATWHRATLHAPGRATAGEGHGWTQWSYTWHDPQPGAHTLLARATDALGRTQPDETPYNANGYFFDAVVRHPVTVV
ncbi:sulfite oxidase [Nocardioides sp. KR10-350]|uniref:sulfite oxidase n=1 Tax=Nocardioides cheoyonin TaxID=3156615 RepID=UPI0032B622AA